MIRRTATLLILALGLAGGCSQANRSDPDPAVRTPSAAPATTTATPTATPSRAPEREFRIEERELDFSRGPDRPLETTVWYPADGDGPFPLVVFSHGLASEPAAYTSVLRPWARAGFVVAAPRYPHTAYRVPDFDAVDVLNQPADAAEVITRMLAVNRKPGDPLAGRIDPDRIAAAGHSAGGVTTIGMFSGVRDERLDAGIVLSGRRVLPVPFAGEPAPMLFVHGKRDRTVRYAEGLAAFDAVPWPKAMMAVTEGGHVAITKDFLPVIATTTDFLRWALYGDERARDRLAADATKGKRATLIDRL
ncbi:MAG TPA: chlorophyllase [Actinoplanes sp.]|nr:chlorophyllase [Actinoplanes sp.]